MSIEAIKLWNEPNNLSHWDFAMDPEWREFAAMTIGAARRIAELAPGVRPVLGGLSPIDPHWLTLIEGHGVLEHVDVVAVHGFPLDWNHWKLDEWPDRIAEVEAVTRLPVWVTEVGVSTFGADEVQLFGLRRTTELLRDRVERVFWYSLLDLPRTWPATTRHRESEGSSYYRHFYMGLVREDGTPKPALDHFDPALGLCQWFHFEDQRLDEAVRWMRRLGVRYLRTGVSWADSLRPGGLAWLDRLMNSLAEFEVTATFCFTPESLGVRPHHTSAPRELDLYSRFCCEMLERFAHLLPRTARPDQRPTLAAIA